MKEAQALYSDSGQDVAGAEAQGLIGGVEASEVPPSNEPKNKGVVETDATVAEAAEEIPATAEDVTSEAEAEVSGASLAEESEGAAVGSEAGQEEAEDGSVSTEATTAEAEVMTAETPTSETDSDGSAENYIATPSEAEAPSIAEVTTGMGAVSAQLPPKSDPPKRNIYAALKEDNLQIVEGVGPKMNEVLNNAGVNTWSDLAAKSPQELRAILDAANAKRYRIIDPSTWDKQASLAHKGEWEALVKMQKNLDTGRAQGATGETDSKVEKLLIKMGVLKRWKQDDLTAVEGVGPKISGLLQDAGITTWRALANAESSKIQSILDAAGKRYKLADPSTWPKQAEMAADGRWDDLQEYQDFLQGGK